MIYPEIRITYKMTHVNNLDSRARMFQDIRIHNNNVEDIYMEYHGYEGGEFRFKDEVTCEKFWEEFSDILCGIMQKQLYAMESSASLYECIEEAIEECVEHSINANNMCIYWDDGDTVPHQFKEGEGLTSNLKPSEVAKFVKSHQSLSKN